MLKKTKIICTQGPATDAPGIIEGLIENGMNAARFNFSHGDHEGHKKRIDAVKAAAKSTGKIISLILDTKGPEMRLGLFKDGSVQLVEGNKFILRNDDIEGDETQATVNHKLLYTEVKVGDKLLLNDGLVELRIDEIKDKNIYTTILNSGKMSSRKRVAAPGVALGLPAISEQDKKDILFGIENDIDFVAASFISTKSDALAVREFLNANGGDRIDIIAKIENRAGVDNIESICEACEGIMIARGDLGVEIPFVEVPSVQKMLISKCRMLGKRVITATEMLETMIQNPRPTRAEISDVANAVYDGSSAVMLSGESAAGKYPVDAVRNMAEICEYTEQHINYHKRFLTSDFRIKNNLDAISHATCAMAIDVNAKAIVVCSVSGTTARMVSRFRCPVDIIGMTTNKKVWRKLALSWGVTPVLSEEFDSIDVMFYTAKKCAKKCFGLEAGSNIVLTGGQTNGITGNTNTIKVEQA